MVVVSSRLVGVFLLGCLLVRGEGGGGGAQSAPLFLFVKTIEKVIRLCTMLNFFLSGGCEDMDILWAFFINLSIESIYLSPELREK